MRNRIRDIGPLAGSVVLLGALVGACAEPSEEGESIGAQRLALTSVTITFDESGLPSGSSITNEFQAQGVIFSAPADGTLTLFDATAGN